MKQLPSNRRGSALLIVLGMLSFMIVSAVAFSVYMRMSRAPSSFLRRNVATRHLVQAALARAIEDIDDKIGNDPYPGIGSNATESRNYTALDRWKYSGYEDSWTHRVFTPYANSQGDTTVTRQGSSATGSSGTKTSNVLEFDDTVAVLTLEGLGYIPPPLVNQARYWSRRTSTARWHRFNYDLGRWAYVAINVSDLLDVHSISAYTNRNSGASGRLSLAALVEDASGQKGNSLKSFDERVRTPTVESQVPLVSMMDWNLSFGATAFGNMPTPFYDWIKMGGKNGFYGGEQVDRIEPLLFVTDSWYPSTNQFLRANSDENYYLSNARDQPFLNFSNSKGMLEFFKNSYAGTGESMNVLKSQLRAAGVACLYDYLDEDSCPISLALPTVEQAPMIVGVAPVINGLQLRLEAGNVENNENTGEKTTHFLCKGLSGTLGVHTGAIFPFKRLSGTRQKTGFKVQAMMKLFFAAKDLQTRVGNEAFHPNEAAWNRSGQAWYDASVITLVSQQKPISDLPNANDFKTGDSQDALVSIPMFTFDGVNAVAGIDSQDFLTVYEREEKKDTEGKVTQAAVAPRIDTVNFRPFLKDGALSEWNKETQKFTVEDYVLTAAVWVRVIDTNGDTVDMAPATLTDDNLNYTLGLTQSQADSVASSICGSGIPLFYFQAGMAEMPYARTSLPLTGAGEKPFVVQQPTDWFALYCYDPRFNYAPEDWYATKDGAMGVDVDKWYDSVKDLLGADGRDSDMFMFVSNQQYLQSVGELAFLPRLQTLDANGTGGGVLTGEFFDAGRYGGAGYGWADRVGFNVNSAANRNFFWRTYRSFEQDGLAADPIYHLKDGAGLGLFDDDGRGPKVNPYTSDTRCILKAALANTPYDYWAASTNKQVNSGAKVFGGNPATGLDYAFGKDSQLAKITDEEMEKIIPIVGDALRARTDGDWLAAFNGLDWYGKDPSQDDWAQCFLQETKNLNETALHSVDRKFLYSFWRSCFGNRQQLFLVFVRAEPSVLGGAQQGGRAVALVWRDPAPPAGGNYATRRSRAFERYQESKDTGLLPPHRTRVLFYHPFD